MIIFEMLMMDDLNKILLSLHKINKVLLLNSLLKVLL